MFPAIPEARPISDTHDLEAFGYKQELSRSLGGFSSFAAGFSYLSILTGVFQMFHVGFAAGGPAFWWAWPIIFVGQFLVALCFAELAAQYPLSGSVYQWSKFVGSRALGWMAGWFYLACLVITLAAVALALQTTLPQISPAFQVLADGTKNAVLLGCILIAFTTAINAIGVKLLARINDLGVFAELTGAVVLIGLLGWHGLRGPGVVLDTGTHGSGFGYAGPLLAAALMPSYVMYGFDTAGSLAEETTEPRRHVPRAILLALASAALLGGLLMLLALMAAPDLRAAGLGDPTSGLPGLVKAVLGGPLGTFFLCDVGFAICVCALAVHTGTARLMYAMARDGMLPAALARVNPTSHTPVVPVWLTGAAAVGVLVSNMNFTQIVGLIVSVSILWANLAYLFVTVPLLAKRLRGWSPQGGFSLGRFGVPVNLAAVLWGCFMVINIGWPRADVYGPGLQSFAAIGLTALVALAGALYYALVLRRKPTEAVKQEAA
ncbi:MAG: puuP [Cyanobacteria bacterium RYN_339]|nr:puuP [Cyanobacteria bacterium RYN_339]